LKLAIKNKILNGVKEKLKERRRSSILALKQEEERIKIDQAALHQLIEEADMKNDELQKVKSEISALYREVNFNSRAFQDFDVKKRILDLKEELEEEIREGKQLSEEILKNEKEEDELKRKSREIEGNILEMEDFLSSVRGNVIRLNIPDFRSVLADQIACLKGLASSYKQSNRLSEIENEQKRICNII
jgi:DNA repair exonuclease SbcCD ATPase subunit